MGYSAHMPGRTISNRLSMNTETTFAVHKLSHKAGNMVAVVVDRNNSKLY